MGGRSQEEAAAAMAFLLKAKLPGGKKSNQATIKLAKTGARTIWKQFQVLPRQWQLKHVLWLLNRNEEKFKGQRYKYKYWLAIRHAINCLGKWEHWQKLTKGPWCRPDGTVGAKGPGGRPGRKLKRMF